MLCAITLKFCKASLLGLVVFLNHTVMRLVKKLYMVLEVWEKWFPHMQILWYIFTLDVKWHSNQNQNDYLSNKSNWNFNDHRFTLFTKRSHINTQKRLKAASISWSVTISRSLIYLPIDGSTVRRSFQTLPCVSMWALGDEGEAMIIEANHRHICWAHERNDQSALFRNLLNSALSWTWDWHEDWHEREEIVESLFLFSLRTKCRVRKLSDFFKKS